MNNQEIIKKINYRIEGVQSEINVKGGSPVGHELDKLIARKIGIIDGLKEARKFVSNK